MTHGDVGLGHISKVSRESYHRMNRKRGRTVRPESDED
jgi:hypothetical protein